MEVGNSLQSWVRCLNHVGGGGWLLRHVLSMLKVGLNVWEVDFKGAILMLILYTVEEI